MPPAPMTITTPSLEAFQETGPYAAVEPDARKAFNSIAAVLARPEAPGLPLAPIPGAGGPSRKKDPSPIPSPRPGGSPIAPDLNNINPPGFPPAAKDLTPVERAVD